MALPGTRQAAERTVCKPHLNNRCNAAPSSYSRRCAPSVLLTLKAMQRSSLALDAVNSYFAPRRTLLDWPTAGWLVSGL
jgi:hypothetical protein